MKRRDRGSRGALGNSNLFRPAGGIAPKVSPDTRGAMRHAKREKPAARRSDMLFAPIGPAPVGAIAASVGMEQISEREFGLEQRHQPVDGQRQPRQLVSIVSTPNGATCSMLERPSAKPTPMQWPSPAIRPILLIAPLTITTAGGVGAQTIIGPGTISSTQVVSGQTATVVGNTTINVPGGDGIDAPPDNGAGGTLKINAEVGVPAIGGPILIITPAPEGPGWLASFPPVPRLSTSTQAPVATLRSRVAAQP